jgi:hypothetical protein
MAGAGLLQLAVVVVVNTVLGMVWYSDSVGFGLAWMRAHGLTMEKINARGNDPTPMLVATAAGLLQAYVAEQFLPAADGPSTLEAQLRAVVTLWLGFTGSAIAMHGAFVTPFWVSTLLIDGGYHLVQLLLLVAIRTYVF